VYGTDSTRRGRSASILTEGFGATITEYLIASFVNAGMAIAALAYFVQHFKPAAGVLGIASGTMCALSAFLIASVS
jgi:hypothetical protein